MRYFAQEHNFELINVLKTVFLRKITQIYVVLLIRGEMSKIKIEKPAQKCPQIVHLKSGSEINPECETARVIALQIDAFFRRKYCPENIFPEE